MNVLIIGLDYTLAMDRERVIGDSQDRHILYGKYVSNLFIVVTSPKRMGLGVKRLSENVIVYPTSSRRFLSSWDAYRIGSNICHHNKIDIITTQDPFLAGLVGYWLKRRFSIPLNIQIHGDTLDNSVWLDERKINHAYNQLGKMILRRADSIRVVSNEIKKKVVELGISPDKITNLLTGGGIDIELFLEADGFQIREKYLDSKTNGKIVLFVGKLIKEKNIPNLLRAAYMVVQQYPDTKFLICGDGPEKSNLEALSHELGIDSSVLFLGNIPYRYLPIYYHACDVFVLPSNREGLARVLIEAAASGKPLVTTEVSGARDIVDNGTSGFIVELDNPEMLAERLIALLSNPKLAQEMGRRAKTGILGKYDRSKILKRTIEMWQKTIEYWARSNN